MRSRVSKSSRALLRATLNRFPGARQLLVRRSLRRRYAGEIAHLAGRGRSGGDRPSIVFYTVHKCASVYVGGILSHLARASGMTPLDFEAYIYEHGRTERDGYLVYGPGAAELYRPSGCVYGPFRQFNPAITQIDRFRVVLNLRDPRDVLTSYYFSIAYSHTTPGANAEESRRTLQARRDSKSMSIDEFVLAESERFVELYRVYCDQLFGKPGVLLVKYEEMVSDFPKWLNRIVEFAGMDQSGDAVEELIRTADFSVEAEDFKAKKRQVTPGDHRRKLDSQTIETLNRQFGPSLERLGYAI